MKRISIFCLLVFLGCKDSNKVEFKAVLEEKNVPVVSRTHPEIRVKEVRDISVGLHVINDLFESSTISLIDPGTISNGSTDSVLRSKVLTMMWNEINDVSNEISFSYQDSFFYSLGGWKDQFYYATQAHLGTHYDSDHLFGKLKFKLKVNPLFLGTSSRLSEIIVGSYFFDKKSLSKLSSLRLTKFGGQDELFELGEEFLEMSYSLLDEKIHGPYLLKELNKRSEVLLRIDDYLIEYENGAKERFTDIAKNIDNEFATILLSSPQGSHLFHTKKEESLRDYLRGEGYILHSDSHGRLVAVNNLISDLHLPIDWDSLSYDYLEKGVWVLVGAKSVDAILKQGKKYVVGYAKARELAQKKELSKSAILKNGGNYLLGPLAKGEIVELTISAESHLPQFQIEKKYIEYSVKGKSVSHIPIGESRIERVPIISDTHTGIDCTVWDRSYIGDFSRPMIFSDKVLDEQIRVVIDDQEYDYWDLLFEGNQPAYLDGGKQVKMRLLVPENCQVFKVRFKGNEKITQEKIGFMGWHRCPNRSKSGFEVIGYDFEPRTFFSSTKFMFSIHGLFQTVL